MLSVFFKSSDTDAIKPVLGFPFRTVPTIAFGNLSVGSTVFVTPLTKPIDLPEADVDLVPDVVPEPLETEPPVVEPEPDVPDPADEPEPVLVEPEPVVPAPDDPEPPEPEPVVAEPELAPAPGVEELDATELDDVPDAFVAVTVNV